MLYGNEWRRILLPRSMLSRGVYFFIIFVDVNVWVLIVLLHNNDSIDKEYSTTVSIIEQKRSKNS